METVHRDNVDIRREVLLKSVSLWCLDRSLTSYSSARFRRRAIALDDCVQVCRFDRVDDQVRQAGHGVAVWEDRNRDVLK
jgi:hypothetical protein